MELVEWLIDNIGATITTALVLVACGYALLIYIIWRFIASAVQRGVEEALQNTTVKTSPSSTYILANAVENGVLQAFEIMDAKKNQENNIVDISDFRKGDKPTE